MHRALSLPELLLSVFACLDHQSNAKAARVCRSWSEHALNELWKDVDIMILQSLAPIDKTLLEECSGIVSLHIVKFCLVSPQQE